LTQRAFPSAGALFPVRLLLRVINEELRREEPFGDEQLVAKYEVYLNVYLRRSRSSNCIMIAFLNSLSWVMRVLFMIWGEQSARVDPFILHSAPCVCGTGHTAIWRGKDCSRTGEHPSLLTFIKCDQPSSSLFYLFPPLFASICF